MVSQTGFQQKENSVLRIDFLQFFLLPLDKQSKDFAQILFKLSSHCIYITISDFTSVCPSEVCHTL